MLFKFENDQKKFGCVGSCGYAPASVKTLVWFENASKLTFQLIAAEVRARMCVLDTDNDDELSYDEYADKVNQVCNK